MDRIAIGVCSDQDSKLVSTLLSDLEIEEPEKEFANDSEIREGLEHFCLLKGIKKLHFLVKSSSDSSSNQMTQEIADDLSQGKLSRLDLLAQRIEADKPESSIWFIFAFTWKVADEISYFSGRSDVFHQYMLLNGGAYRLVYVVDRDQYNIDLDTPLVWEIIA